MEGGIRACPPSRGAFFSPKIRFFGLFNYFWPAGWGAGPGGDGWPTAPCRAKWVMPQFCRSYNFGLLDPLYYSV